MNKLDATKKAVSFVVGLGASKIVCAIINNNIQPEKALAKIEVASAAAVVGMMAADATSKYTDAQIDALAAFFQKLKNKSEEPCPEENS